MIPPGLRILKAREELGLESSDVFIQRLEKLSFKRAEAEARRLENRVLNARTTWGHDSRRMLERMFAIREQMGEPIHAEEREALFKMAKPEVMIRLRVEERRLRDKLDARGVPVASWRVKRAMVDPETVAANGVMRSREDLPA